MSPLSFIDNEFSFFFFFFFLRAGGKKMNKIKFKKKNNKIKIKKGLKEDYSGNRRAAQYIPQIQDPRDRMLHEIKREGRGKEITFFLFRDLS